MAVILPGSACPRCGFGAGRYGCLREVGLTEDMLGDIVCPLCALRVVAVGPTLAQVARVRVGRSYYEGQQLPLLLFGDGGGRG